MKYVPKFDKENYFEKLEVVSVAEVFGESLARTTPAAVIVLAKGPGVHRVNSGVYRLAAVREPFVDAALRYAQHQRLDGVSLGHGRTPLSSSVCLVMRHDH